LLNEAATRRSHYATVKIDRNGLQFFYRYILDKQWEWLNIVNPPHYSQQYPRAKQYTFVLAFSMK